MRQTLGDPAQSPHFIQTVHRRDYRFLAQVSVSALPAAGDTVTSLPPPDGGPRVAPAATPRSGPMVGGEAEVAWLRQRLERVQQGARQVVFVSGEARIGITVVVEALLASVGREPPVWVAWGQCLAHYGAGEAYLPVLDALGRLWRTVGQAALWAVPGGAGDRRPRERAADDRVADRGAQPGDAADAGGSECGPG